MTKEAEVGVGTCLREKFSGSIYKVISLDKREYHNHPPVLFYVSRELSTGKKDYVQEGYIPYSFEIVECPDIALPPKPVIKLGDQVRWSYMKGRRKLWDTGKVVGIQNDEVTIEINREICGVKGLAFHDIYEIEVIPPEEKRLPVKIDRERMEEQYSLDEVKQMAKDRGLSTVGTKHQIIKRIVK